jgi:hypothetical protein
MNKEEFLKKYKIDHIYEYYQEQEGRKITFGWKEAYDVDLSSPVIISYPSKAKNISAEYAEWSKKEGSNVVSSDSYKRWIKAFSGKEYIALLNEWEEHKDLFPEWWSSQHTGHKKELGEFVLGIAFLLRDGGKFKNFGRIYKEIVVEGE